MAHKLAGDAAGAACLPLNVTSPYLYYMSLVTRIRARLATMLIQLPNGEKVGRPAKNIIPKASIKELSPATTHVVMGTATRISRARCHNSFSRSDPSLGGWLNCQCQALGSDADRPIHIPYEDIHIGNQTVHSTHRVFRFKGSVYCNRCGLRASTCLLYTSPSPRDS